MPDDTKESTWFARLEQVLTDEALPLGRFSVAEASYLVCVVANPGPATSAVEQAVDGVVVAGLIAHGSFVVVPSDDADGSALLRPSAQVDAILGMVADAEDLILVVDSAYEESTRIGYCSSQVALDWLSDADEGVSLQAWRTANLCSDWAQRASRGSVEPARQWEGAATESWEGPLATLTASSNVTTTFSSTRGDGDGPVVVICDDGHGPCWLGLTAVAEDSEIRCVASRVVTSALAGRLADLLLPGRA